ncbi:MAG: acetate--CoA ligase family protein [Candidatus Scalinduaceae bacterium]
MALEKFFNPKSVAIIGATENPQNITSTIIANLIKMGFKGRLLPVNPRHKEVFGLKCYSSLLDIKERIELTVIAIPSYLVPEVLRQQAMCGIRNSIIVSGGFGELGDKGIAIEEEIKTISKEEGISIIGPNCIGVLDNYSNFSTSFLPWERVKRPAKGHLSILSQSGSFAICVLDMLAQEGIGVSKVVSYGNRADIGESELIEYLTADESTHVIVIYMESVDDGRRFISASNRCSRSKPMIVLKVGKRISGIDAARSHTGAIAGKYEIYKAAFKKSGIVEVNGFEEFTDACKVLLMQKPARGNKILIITNGGGVGVVVSDMCGVNGLDVARTPSGVKEALSKRVSEYYILDNPIDLTGSAVDEDYDIAMKSALVDDDSFDAAIVIPLMPPQTMTEGVVKIVSQRAKESGKPVVICTIGGEYTRKIKVMFEEKGLPVFPSPERCVKAMSLLVESGRIRSHIESIPLIPRQKTSMIVDTARFKDAVIIIENAISSGRKTLFPDEALCIIKSCGITTPDCVLVKTAKEALGASRAIGFPVVLKIVSSDVLHKSDVGGVVVGIKNEKEVKRNYDEIMNNLIKEVPDANIMGMLVEKQAPKTTEVIVGGIRDEQFGPTVMFGLGGVFVELFKDVTFGIAPVTETEALEMIKEIKGYSTLSGYRGAKPLDILQLTKTIVTISQLISNIDYIKEVELNPLLVYEKGVIAVDARVILKKK